MLTTPSRRAVNICPCYVGLSNRRVVLLAMMYGMTMTLKNEVVKIAPKGRVNSVAPGLVRTPMAESALADPDVLYRALAT